MRSGQRKGEKNDGHWLDNQGLFRGILAGPGRTLEDAFASLERAPCVERIWHHPTRDLLGARVKLSPEEGRGYWEFTWIRGEIYVVIANFAYKDSRIELVPGEGLLSFTFKISGDMALAMSRMEPLRWNRPSLLVWSQPTGVDIREWTAPSAREQFIFISMRPEFLAKHFLTNGAEIPHKLRSFVSSQGNKINYCQYPLSVQAFDVVTKLIDNPYEGATALVYTEALVLELICQAVGDLSSLSGTPNGEYTGHELRCLESARNVIMRQFAPVPRIDKLARSVGMSKSKLRKGFKAVYGETLFEFSLRCRMRHALTLIRDHRWSVEKTAAAVGYAHPTTFTTAFRRHFDMRPSDVRRRKSL